MSERAPEQKSIYKFLRDAILADGRTNNAMFVAGPPGSGKTASVNAVVKALEVERSGGEIPDFKFVSINGMELRHPSDAYTMLWECITGGKEKRSADVSATLLEKFFGGAEQVTSKTETTVTTHQLSNTNKKTRTVTLLLLDEMDYLVTKKQTVLYNLFDWPTRTSRHGLVIIGIANTINLPERLLPRVQSRLGLLRLTFQAYTVDQMVSILRTRLSGTLCFEDGALNFAARKTVGLSGDVRRAFQVCQEAARKVMERGPDSNGKTTVTVRDVVSAVKSMTDVPHLQSLRRCTDFEALVVVSLASLLMGTGREGGVGVSELLQKMSGAASQMGDPRYLPSPTMSELIMMLDRLSESRIVILEVPRNSSTRQAAAGNPECFHLCSYLMYMMSSM